MFHFGEEGVCVEISSFSVGFSDVWIRMWVSVGGWAYAITSGGRDGERLRAGRIDWRKKLRSRPDLSVLLSVDRQRKKAKRLWQSTARDSSSGVPTKNTKSARRQIAQPMCRQESTFLLPVHSVEFSNRLSRLFKKRRRGRLMASEGTSTRNK